MKTKPLMGIAALIAVLVTGVYVINGGSGNTAAGTECQLADDQRALLKETTKGEVAAFRLLDEPLDIGFISFKDRDGNDKTLADWKGKTVLFNLWATWCPPCREEMPYLETLQQEHGDEKFEVVPVSIDLGDAQKPEDFYAETGLDQLPFYHDGTMKAFDDLKRKAIALGMPTTLIVDDRGCGIGVLNGPAHWASPDAVNLIKTAINASEKN